MRRPMLSLDERLDAYLRVVNEHPELSADERQELFSFALWPKEPEVDYEHLMLCRDPFCVYCAGTGELAA